MGEPFLHIPVKLITGLLSPKLSGFTDARTYLEKKFGQIDNESRVFNFSCTSYYEKEFGGDLKRKFFSFKKLARLNGNYRVKLYTNSVEKKLAKKKSATIDSVDLNRISGGQYGRALPGRTVNIDPGYVSLSKMVLFTTKNRSHRIYIDGGIYADLEFQFVKKSFRALPWTYPDYRTREYIDFFNSVRKIYLGQVERYI